MARPSVDRSAPYGAVPAEDPNRGGLAAGLDALMPPAMTAKAEDIGVSKAGMSALRTFVLAVLAGAFIARPALPCRARRSSCVPGDL